MIIYISLDVKIDQLQSNYLPPCYSPPEITPEEDEQQAKNIYKEGIEGIVSQYEESIQDESEFLKFAMLVNPAIAYFGKQRIQLAKDAFDSLLYHQGKGCKK